MSYVFLTKRLALKSHYSQQNPCSQELTTYKGTYYHLHFIEMPFCLCDTPNINPWLFTLKQNLSTCCYNTIQHREYMDLFSLVPGRRFFFFNLWIPKFRLNWNSDNWHGNIRNSIMCVFTFKVSCHSVLEHRTAVKKAAPRGFDLDENPGSSFS